LVVLKSFRRYKPKKGGVEGEKEIPNQHMLQGGRALLTGRNPATRKKKKGRLIW